VTSASKCFADRLFDAVRQKDSVVVAGLDPHLDRLPGPEAGSIEQAAEQVVQFFGRLIELVAEHVVAVKPQAAFFEALGLPGWQAYQLLLTKAREHGLLVIGDIKRGDIGSTSAAYARAHLSDAAGQRSDAVTVNPYLGTDGIAPFVEVAAAEGGGLFVLVKTSNPSSAEFQDQIYQQVAAKVVEWGKGLVGQCGYSAVGAVVGATHPELTGQLRSLLPGVPILLPGYGAQGAGAEQLRGWFDDEGLGAVVPASRSLAFGWTDESDWEDAVAAAAIEMKQAINRVR